MLPLEVVPLLGCANAVVVCCLASSHFSEALALLELCLEKFPFVNHHLGIRGSMCIYFQFPHVDVFVLISCLNVDLHYHVIERIFFHDVLFLFVLV